MMTTNLQPSEISPTDCSIFRGSRIKLAIVTHPEGAEHPYVIGTAGDCTECWEGLTSTAQKYDIPVEITTIDRDLEHDMCECRSCGFMRHAIWPETFNSKGEYDPS